MTQSTTIKWSLVYTSHFRRLEIDSTRTSLTDLTASQHSRERYEEGESFSFLSFFFSRFQPLVFVASTPMKLPFLPRSNETTINTGCDTAIGYFWILHSGRVQNPNFLNSKVQNCRYINEFI